MTLLLAILLAFADVTAIKGEPDLDKRSELALANADHAIDEARKAYSDGDDKALKASLAEVQESVELSFDALRQAPGQPRKNKYYKRAELKVRALVRRLNGFRQEVSFDTQQSVDPVIRKLSDVHDQLLNAIMSKKK